MLAETTFRTNANDIKPPQRIRGVPAGSFQIMSLASDRPSSHDFSPVWKTQERRDRTLVQGLGA
jgi:hypothetical protein